MWEDEYATAKEERGEALRKSAVDDDLRASRGLEPSLGEQFGAGDLAAGPGVLWAAISLSNSLNAVFMCHRGTGSGARTARWCFMQCWPPGRRLIALQMSAARTRLMLNPHVSILTMSDTQLQLRRSGGGSRKGGSRRDRIKRNQPTYALVEEDMEWDTEEAPPPRQRPPPMQRRPLPLRDDPLPGCASGMLWIVTFACYLCRGLPAFAVDCYLCCGLLPLLRELLPMHHCMGQCCRCTCAFLPTRRPQRSSRIALRAVHTS